MHFPLKEFQIHLDLCPLSKLEWILFLFQLPTPHSHRERGVSEGLKGLAFFVPLPSWNKNHPLSTLKEFLERERGTEVKPPRSDYKLLRLLFSHPSVWWKLANLTVGSVLNPMGEEQIKKKFICHCPILVFEFEKSRDIFSNCLNNFNHWLRKEHPSLRLM